MKEYTHETDFTHDIVIIGGGAAGLTLAEGAARLGLKTIILEKEKLGGRCLYEGCIPAKNLVRFSALYSTAFNSELFGISSFRTPEPEISPVLDLVYDEIAKNELYDSEERLNDLGAEVLYCNPVFKNRWQIDTGEGHIVSSGKTVIATGSRPCIPDLEGIEKTDYLTGSDIFRLKNLPREMVIIGGGTVGTIIGQSMARLGVRVTVIEKNSQILSFHDSDIADLIESSLEAEGISFIKNAQAVRVEQKGNIKTVYYRESVSENSDVCEITDEKSIMADSLLVAAGRKGNTEDIRLSKAGVETSGGFIVTDDKLRSSCRNICAIGDVNGRYMYTHVAGAEASYILKTLEMNMPGKFSYLNVPWCTYTDPGTATIGYNVKNAEKEGLKFRVAFAEYPELENSGRIKILIDSRDRIIGTQIAGPNADQLLLPSIIAFNKKLKLMDIMAPAYPFPSAGTVYKAAAESVYNDKTFSLHSRKLLRFMYRYRGR